MNRQKAWNRIKKHMEWVASFDTMEAMRKADQCYGFLMGAEIALNATDKEMQEMTEFWDDLRAKIFRYGKYAEEV